ncbi:hypothetical protein H6F76_18325 [Leptolyngbya sp. FACHB-321]|uniref:hypothetical protein n=1 Tax=Leptolyngbya sp. FACHB-321 TaxID=2692807 RepID=UPI001684BDAA|nr:hypothetical protein [Leptolyngbya sp. FACHB-321]MBD2036967.1 hypothetical protein [Leptolyngbya sp. FACHB-321]
MARIICPKCGYPFEANNQESFVTRGGAAAVGSWVGAQWGAGVGLATGGTGMAATVPGAIVGGFMGWFAADQFRQCPQCKKIFKT